MFYPFTIRLKNMQNVLREYYCVFKWTCLRPTCSSLITPLCCCFCMGPALQECIKGGKARKMSLFCGGRTHARVSLQCDRGRNLTFSVAFRVWCLAVQCMVLEVFVMDTCACAFFVMAWIWTSDRSCQPLLNYTWPM